MDDDKFMNLGVLNAKKTYSNKLKKEILPRYLHPNKKADEEIELPEPLTTKVAVKFLLEGRLKSKVCRYCLHITSGLSELDQVMKIGGTGNIYKVTIRDIVASFHPFKVVENPNFPNKICQKCVDKALGAYLFTQQCERAERAMLNCFDDMYEKLEKLDPIDGPKKRGRQKLNPNHNILHAEHNKVMDYAEPIINIINISSETVSREPELNDLECKKCWQVLPNLESLINHEKIHPKTMWYHCRLCGKSFPKCNQLKKHSNRVHVLGKEPTLHPEKEFKCKECGHITDNYIQHLQHVEKHKFKNVMKHLIEKRMDKLCVVCYNKGTKMTDLDKMVCIHGGHADLMGDKTLYTLLATTLPTPNSYKYQDLCLASNAKIMKIFTKQSYEGQENKKVKPIKDSDYVKENFKFCDPIVVTKGQFKTDHFYYYVYTDPEQHKHYNVSDDQITQTKNVEVVNISEVKSNDLVAEVAEPSEEKTHSIEQIDDIADGLNIEVIEGTKMNDVDSDIIDFSTHECTNKEHNSDREINYTFSYPALALDNNKQCTETLPSAPQFVFTNPKQVSEPFEFEVNERLIHKADDNETQSQDLSHKYWIFKNTTSNVKSHDNGKKRKAYKERSPCTFCWIFNCTGFCGYCKRSVEVVEDNDNTTKHESAHHSKDKEEFKVTKDKIWQCSVCLVNNEERLTCQCCGTVRITHHADIKIPFGNNTIFFQNEEKKDTIPTEKSDECIDTSNENLNTTAIIEYLPTMDCKSNSKDNTELESNNNDTMEIETLTFKIAPTNSDIEAMDVEESYTAINNSLSWNNPSHFNFNTALVNCTYPVTPAIRAELQFNIGCGVQSKPVRNFRRVVRTLPKVLHK